MLITGLHHVSMKCALPEELAEVRRFYCDLLGLRVVRELPAGIMLDTGCGMLEVFSNGEGTRTTGAIRHLAFSVSSAAKCADIVKQAGGSVTGMGIAIEKGQQKGGQKLRDAGYHVESIAIIEGMDYETQTVRFRE